MSCGLVRISLVVILTLATKDVIGAIDGPVVPSYSKQETSFDWSIPLDSNNANSPGSITANLSACPAGVRGNEAYYYIYVADGENSEAARVSGGTCRGDEHQGTLQFDAHRKHSPGARIGSASEGLQEEIIATRFAPSNPPGTEQGGRVTVSGREIKVHATVSVRSSGMTVDLSGSILECQTPDACIFVGDPLSSILFSDITLISPRGRPTVKLGQSPFIEVNAQGTRLMHVSTRVPLSGGTFGSLVQVDDDQAFLLDGLSTQLGGTGVRCDSTVCNPVIVAPGPFNKYSAVGWLKNMNLSIGCQGNGVEWLSGNSLRISDSVIQGYAQYGVRAGTRRGGYGGFALENVYEEVGNCKNPLGNIGQAGVIAQGAGVFGLKIEGGVGPAGVVPHFANTGSSDYRYYVVARQATLGFSNPLYAGNALTNGTGNITITTPDISGAEAFDLLRTTTVPKGRNFAPYGTGNYAVATNISRASACVNDVCTFTDTQSPLQAYTIAPPQYFPILTFWPGALILSANSDSRSPYAPARAYLDDAFQSIVSVLGMAGPSVFSNRCEADDQWTPLWQSCLASVPPSSFHEQGSLLMMVKPNQDGGGQLNLKGRINFAQLGTAPGHIVTLSDSDFQKTVATANNRPPNDPNDAYIGYDQADGNPTNVGISFGAPKTLSNYIGSPGDGKAWLERLSKTLKTFRVPVSANAFLTNFNCASSKGDCGAAAAGRVTIAAGSSTVTVTTTAVTPDSEVHIDENFSYGPKLGVRCNRSMGRKYVVVKQDQGSFVIETDNAPTGDPACLSFSISN